MPKQALVKAFVDSVEEFEGDAESEPEVDEAQERIGKMLNDMLFLSPQRSAVDDDKSKSENENSAEIDKADIEEGQNDDEEVIESTEGTALLSETTPNRNLRPSIFTTIAEHMDRKEKEKINEEDEKWETLHED